MTCKEFKQHLDALLAAEPSPLIDRAIDEHISQCAVCRAEHKAAMEVLALLQSPAKPMSTDQLKERIMNRIANEAPAPAPSRRRLGFVKPAMAAAAAFAVLALVVYPAMHTVPSYAFAQTIDATRSIQSVHLRTTPTTFGSVDDAWAEFADAQLIRVRMNFHDTEDGPKDVIWENGRAQVWFKKKNCLTTIREPDLAEHLRIRYEFFDPAHTAEKLYEMAKQGAPVEIEEPARPGDPIVVRVTRNSACSEVYTIDSETKLLLRRQSYKGDQIESTTEFLEYNQVDPSVFALEVPADVMRVDMTQGVGLEQGAMSDAEIATKVVREFLDALIARDYAKASPLSSGIPAERLREMFKGTSFLRVVSIGQPEPHQETGSLRVPCKIEVEREGKADTYEPDGPFVRQVPGRPGYWSIIGGV